MMATEVFENKNYQRTVGLGNFYACVMVMTTIKTLSKPCQCFAENETFIESNTYLNAGTVSLLVAINHFPNRQIPAHMFGKGKTMKRKGENSRSLFLIHAAHWQTLSPAKFEAQNSMS